MVSPAYAAGFFDGEGCIYIQMNSAGWAALRVEAVQVKSEVLKCLQSVWGGKLKECTVREREHSRTIWQLTSTNEIKKFLGDIYPHCVVKKEEVWLGLEFLEQRTNSKGGGGSAGKLTVEEKALRTGFMLALRNCKVAGNKGNRMFSTKERV